MPNIFYILEDFHYMGLLLVPISFYDGSFSSGSIFIIRFFLSNFFFQLVKLMSKK